MSIVACVLFVISVEHARASCDMPPPLCQAWRSYAAIFDGTVRSIERVDREETFRDEKKRIGHRLVTFDVHETWTGPVGKEARLVLWGGYQDEDGYVSFHGFQVEVGERYLILAHWNAQGELTAAECGQSKAYKNAGQELEFLRSLRGSNVGGRVFGRVLRSANEVRSPPSPFDIPITLTGNGTTRTITSKGGEYVFTGLPGGLYSVAAAPVDNLGGHDSRTVTLPGDGSCAKADFYFFHTGSIGGTLTTNSGPPGMTTRVEAAPAATWRSDRSKTVSTYTDPQGRFEFGSLPPGDYVIAVNLVDDVAYQSYARTLFRNDDAPELAQLAAGQRLELDAWDIGTPLKPVVMRLRLVDPSGAPLRKQDIDLFDVTRPDNPDDPRHVLGDVTDANGWVEYTGKSTRKYAIGRSTEWSDEIVPLSTSFAAEAATKGLTVVVYDKQGRRRLQEKF